MSNKGFFSSLLNFFRSSKRRSKDPYVKIVQKEKEDSGKSGTENTKTRRKRFDKPVLAWTPAKNLLKEEQNIKGKVIDISMKSETSAQVLNQVLGLKVESQKRGLSSVKHKVSFGLSGDVEEFLEAVKEKTPVVFFYRSVYGDFQLLGDKSGLILTDSEEAEFVFEGIEDNVFYNITENIFNQIVPSEENK